MANQRNVGFIGLGIMGAPMAGHLRAAGHTLFVHDVNPAPQTLVDAGVTVCTSAEEVAKRADIIVIMVPDTPHVEAVLFADKGVAAALKAAGKEASYSKIVVDMSSISPIATKDSPRASTSWALRTWTRRCRARSRRQGRLADDHGWWSGRSLRPGQAAVRADGQEHHAGGRQR